MTKTLVQVSRASTLLLATALILGPAVAGNHNWIGLEAYEPWAQTAKLTPDESQPGMQFGEAFAVDGDTLVVGHPLWDDEDEQDVIHIEETTVCGVGCVTIGEPVEHLEDVGMVSVFEREAGEWDLVSTFVGDQENGAFGDSLALDGDTFVTTASGTAQYENRAWHCPDSTAKLYVHERVDGTWQRTATLEAPGHMPGDSCLGGTLHDASNALAMAGDTLVVGTGHADSDVFVYERQLNGSWALEASVTYENDTDQHSFGWDVDVTDDGDRLVIGHLDNPDGVHVHVYDRTPDGWVGAANLTAWDPVGSSVSISGDGLTVTAASHVLSRIPLTVWESVDGEWSHANLVRARDEVGIEPRISDVHMDATGEMIVVGAWQEESTTGMGPRAVTMQTSGCGLIAEDVANPCDGAVYVFKRNGEDWVQTAKLVQADDAGWDFFGWAVQLEQGNLIVGAPGQMGRSGAVYTFNEVLQIGEDALS